MEATMSEGRTIRVYDYVNQPFERVHTVLLKDARGIFQRATTIAHERAGDVVSGLRVNIAGIEIGKEVQIEVVGFSDSQGHTPDFPLETRIDLKWSAVGSPALFPTMTAQLVMYPLSSKETQLDLRGTYEPPFGPLGVVLNALVGHRVAEASVHQFITDVAERLRRDLA